MTACYFDLKHIIFDTSLIPYSFDKTDTTVCVCVYGLYIFGIYRCELPKRHSGIEWEMRNPDPYRIDTEDLYTQDDTEGLSVPN